MGELFHPTSDEKLNKVLESYHFEVPDGWSLETMDLGGVSVERLKAQYPESGRVILQLHGGGYTDGLVDSHRLLGAKQGILAKAAAVYYVNYRLAPRYTYPAALEDAIAVYRGLIDSGTNAKNIIVIDDSAGGNLALELSLYLKKNGIAQPGALILMSPWTTFETNGNSRRENKERDLVLGEKASPLYYEVKKPSYAKGMKAKDPRLSPIYANMSGLPPMLVQVGGYELFLDDGLSLAKKSSVDGNKITMTVYPGMPHDFTLLLPDLNESALSLQEFKEFVNRHMN